jgi:hypothetical protein
MPGLASEARPLILRRSHGKQLMTAHSVVSSLVVTSSRAKQADAWNPPGVRPHEPLPWGAEDGQSHITTVSRDIRTLILYTVLPSIAVRAAGFKGNYVC